MRVAAVVVCAVALVGSTLGAGDGGSPVLAARQQAVERPNFVVVYTDDQTVEQMRALPGVAAYFDEHGVSFANSVVSYPLCCPSRATLLTGQYTHNNGVRTNFAASNDNSLPRDVSDVAADAPTRNLESWAAFHQSAESGSMAVALEQSGYHTGWLGKYLNEYGDARVGNSPTVVPPGWTDFRAAIAPWSADYWATRINDNGTVRDLADQYQTDAYAELALDMIDDADQAGAPFFLTFSFFAPHIGHRVTETTNQTLPYPEVAPRHAAAFVDERAPRTPAFNERDLTDKPAFLQRRYPRLSRERIEVVDERWRRELQSLLAVDEAFAGILSRLDDLGLAENTVVIFTSDNGYFHGEHRVAAKKYLPYEPSLRVPLLIAGPAVAVPLKGTESSAPVANIDLAPTILDLAGVEPLRPPDGRSLRPLLQAEAATWSGPGGRFNPSGVRERAVYIMGVKHSRAHPATYSGVRAGRYVYWKWENHGRGEELYDLTADPYQVENLAGRPGYRSIRNRLERQRRLLLRCRAASCEVPPYGYLDLPRSGAAPWRSAATWADANGIGAAHADGTFRPSRAITRGDYLLWLWRQAGAPTGHGPHGLRDVPRRLRSAARWAVATGVIVDPPRLDPGGTLTRRKGLRWTWRAAGRPGGFGPHPYVDVSRRSPPLRWAAATGVVRSGSSRFRPDQALRRTGAVRWVRRSATAANAPPPTLDAPEPAAAPAATSTLPPTTSPPAPTLGSAPPTAPPTTSVGDTSGP